MDRVILDTSYCVALLNRRDQLHARAIALSQRLASNWMLTSEMVLTELLNGCSDDPQLRETATTTVQALRRTQEVTIVPQTPELFERAFQKYVGMSDKGWSLTDCASFIIMEDAGLTAALTHDHHFTQAGFQALLR